jgi:hypothetical protein
MESRVEYSPHYLVVKQNLTKVYEMLNEHKFVKAASLLDETIVELRLMRNAVKTYVE